MAWLNGLFKSKETELEKENALLKQKLDECGKKLIEKQEHINKTNAYWKKKMYSKKKD